MFIIESLFLLRFSIPPIIDKKKPTLVGTDFTEEVISDFSDKYLRLRELDSVRWTTAHENNLKKEDRELGTFVSLK